MAEKYSEKLKLIGLTGTNGAGKGEAGKYFAKKGFDFFSLSDEIRDELRKRKMEINRDNLIKVGNELREKFGADILARRVLKKVKKNSVVDSIRNPAEIKYLKKHGNFILISIDAPVLIRFQRIKKRGRMEGVNTLEEFIEKEEKELKGSKNAQQLINCMKMADYTVINDGTIKEFHRKLEEILNVL